ncbi:hypothetical protein KFY51_28440, partial [Salmonella enterica subsp. enterica serovar 1,4,[5],12:i:-]|nr:hypothetical protein [Salmonella enterica subsp. enterica serovar 1,4,[5],12:i:-]
MQKKTLAVALSGALSGLAQGADADRPNVLIILVDDMGYSDISPFGGEIPRHLFQHALGRAPMTRLRGQQQHLRKMLGDHRHVMQDGDHRSPLLVQLRDHLQQDLR